MKKDKKPQSRLQEIASTRNWLKARIIGARSIKQSNLFTIAERRIVDDIDKLYKLLLETWDEKTKVIINDNTQI